MKTYIRRDAKPDSREALRLAILEFWRTKLTRFQCDNYINHLFTVLPKVIELEGRASSM